MWFFTSKVIKKTFLSLRLLSSSLYLQLESEFSILPSEKEVRCRWRRRIAPTGVPRSVFRSKCIRRRNSGTCPRRRPRDGGSTSRPGSAGIRPSRQLGIQALHLETYLHQKFKALKMSTFLIQSNLVITNSLGLAKFGFL